MPKEIHDIDGLLLKIFTGLVIVVFIVTIGFLAIDEASKVDEQTITSYGSDSFLYVDSSQSLEKGVTSYTATTHNNSWLEFDGVNDYVALLNDDVYNYNWNESYSVSVRTKSYNTSLRQAIISRNIKDELQFQGGNINWLIYNGSTFYVNYINVSNNTLYNIVAVSNITNRKLYSNGGLINETNDFIINDNKDLNPSVSLGARGGGETNDKLNGTIESIAIFNYSLPSDAVRNINWNNNHLVGYLERESMSALAYNYFSNWNDTSILMSGGFGKLYISSNNGESFEVIYNFSDYISDTFIAGIYQIQNKELLTYARGKGLLFKSNNLNLTNQSVSLNLTEIGINENCILNSTTFNSFTTDNYGNIYFGLYSSGDTTEQCAKVFKSEDNASTWSLVYNGTERHIHTVYADPYNNKVYVSMGDGDIQNKLMSSSNQGNTWDILCEGATTPEEMDCQPTAISSYNGYRVFGEDFFDGTNSRSRIFISYDDNEFIQVFDPIDNKTGLYNGFYKYNDSVLITTTAMVQDGAKPKAYLSKDGINWVIAFEQDVNVNGSVSMGQPSFQDTDGYMYFKIAKNLTSTNLFAYRWKYNDFEPAMYLKLNEETGTIAYDSSGNANNGAISGATWNNDGVDVSLTNEVDYSLTPSGVFTILNPDYYFTYITVNYGIDKISSSTLDLKNELANGIDEVSKNIIIMFTIATAVIILGLIYFLTKKSKEGYGESL